MKTYDSDTLLHRRQFILGRRFVEARRHWQRVRVRDTILVTAHPDLNTRQVSKGGMSLTLLGYLLDAEHPERGEEDILHGLLDHLLSNSAFADWVKHTDPLAGRWILIVDDGRDVRLFTDPMGLRQVFYTDPTLTAECWCATQTGLIAEELKLGMDPVAVGEYVNSPPFRAWPEPKWPGDTSPYVEIRHLLPNHVLDLLSGACTRFWPDGPMGALSLNESASVSAELLRGIMRSAAARFDLAISMTAGWDTRLMLAGSRDIADRVYFYTYSRETETVDATIAPRLLTSLGLTPHLVPVPPQMDAGLEQLYNRSYSLAHAYTGLYLQALWNEVPAGRLRVTGNAAEITRARFRLPKGATVVTPRYLARSSMSTGGHCADQMERIPFVLRAWERWLAGVGNSYDVHLLDLFYWEHWAGNFAAMDQAQEDMALDALTPINCRLLLTRMLAAPEECRDHDHPRLYEEMIRRLWPETLAEPVNPSPPRSLAMELRPLAGELRLVLGSAARRASRRVRSVVTLAVRASGLYPAAKGAFDRIQKKRRME